MEQVELQGALTILQDFDELDEVVVVVQMDSLLENDLDSGDLIAEQSMEGTEE